MSTFTNSLSDRPDSHEARRTGLDDRLPQLRRTGDGMIDYDFYIRRGHRLRSEAAHGLLTRAAKAVSTAITRRSHRRRTAAGHMPHAA